MGAYPWCTSHMNSFNGKWKGWSFFNPSSRSLDERFIDFSSPTPDNDSRFDTFKRDISEL
jgi:hypothetical protein